MHHIETKTTEKAYIMKEIKNGIIFNTHPDHMNFGFWVNNKLICTAKKEENLHAKIKAYNEDNTPVQSSGTSEVTVKKSEFSVKERFEFIKEFTKLTAHGVIPSMIVTGSGGLGKSHTVLNTLRNIVPVEVV